MLVPNPSTYYSGMHIHAYTYVRVSVHVYLVNVMLVNVLWLIILYKSFNAHVCTHTLTPKHTCPHLHTSTHVHTQTQTTLAHTSTQTTCAHEYAHPHAHTHTHVRMVENLLIIIAFFPIQQLMVAIGNTAANRFWEHHLQQEKLDAEVER